MTTSTDPENHAQPEPGGAPCPVLRRYLVVRTIRRISKAARSAART
ncbi:hypothetical protein [Streptomyces sp. bgisy060]